MNRLELEYLRRKRTTETTSSTDDRLIALLCIKGGMAAMVITLGKSREHNGNKFPEKLLLINKSLYLHVGPSTRRGSVGGGGWTRSKL